MAIKREEGTVVAKHWKRITTAAGIGMALLWLATACTSQRQIPADAPSVTPAAESSAEESAAASATARSRISEPESSPPAGSPSASQSPESTAAVSPSVQPSASVSDTTVSERETAQPTPASPPAAKPASPSPSPTAVAKEITLSIIGNAKWGTVVPADKIDLKNHDTVADLLIRTLKAHKLAFEKRGSGALFYMVGIDGLYEFDDGPTSGWKYRVNGKEPGVGAGSFEPKPGDKVEWIYASEDAKPSSDGKGSAP
jgi:hypothetical protein